MITPWTNDKNPPHPYSMWWRMGGEDIIEKIYKTHQYLNNPIKNNKENEAVEEADDEYFYFFSKKYAVPNTKNHDEMYKMAEDKYINNRTEYGKALAKSDPPIYWLIRCYELMFEQGNYDFYGYD